ncbi:TetR/AcrR family transcriptional regulator [Burkholderia sp. L27(2015)]|jgi:AcrR family transcriptional regulator|uniref:TetR/AcrR family transcriptional regulator n=1 Tax=Burkholderia sp. L27(2015) TaxID=1641858 RepID=UPI00131E422A|nr:TetR/AcrR family transcriptional regulator [Burkholderia sp. L27(2015)]
MAPKQARTPLAPRKTPTQRRSADTVDAIIEAAARILEEQGFEGYTTNAVAQRAGVSIGSLYQYFPGKDALTSALIERETTVLLANIGTATHASDWATGLRAMISAAVAHQLQRPRLARLLDIEESRLPIQPRNHRVFDMVQAAVVALLRMNPAWAPADLPVMAFDIVAMVRGLTDAAGECGGARVEALERRVLRAVFGYLSWEEPR